MDDLQHRPNHLPDHEPASVPGTSDTTKTGGLRVENYEASEDMANEVGIPESYMPYFDWDPTCPGSDRLEDVKKEWNLMIRLVERVWSQRDSASMREIAREWFATKSTAAMNVLGNILWLDFEHNVRRSFARVTVTNRDLRSKKKRERHRQEGRTLFLNTRLYYDRPEPSAEISLLEPAFNLSLLGDTDYRTMASKEESSELEHLAGALLHEVTHVDFIANSEYGGIRDHDDGRAYRPAKCKRLAAPDATENPATNANNYRCCVQEMDWALSSAKTSYPPPPATGES